MSFTPVLPALSGNHPSRVLPLTRRASIPALQHRRTTPTQGRALELLGHAIEYLVDSHLVQFEQLETRADSDAVRLLIAASRAVFSQCEVYEPASLRLRRWLSDHLLGHAA